jgi:SAM-dependent methyltransferase
VTLGPDYFDGLYEVADDPWQLATRWYEERKYALTLAALPAPRYRSGLEVGCSVGVLTELLAPRCERLLAVDVAQRAVDIAAERNRNLAGVRTLCRVLPQEWPPGTFDLIVLSEVGYYFAPTDFERLLERIASALEPGGTLVAAHWRHPVEAYPRSGDQVHQTLARQSSRHGLVATVSHAELDFLLQVYLRTPPEARSVAQQTGLA